MTLALATASHLIREARAAVAREDWSAACDYLERADRVYASLGSGDALAYVAWCRANPFEGENGGES